MVLSKDSSAFASTASAQVMPLIRTRAKTSLWLCHFRLGGTQTLCSGIARMGLALCPRILAISVGSPQAFFGTAFSQHSVHLLAERAFLDWSFELGSRRFQSLGPLDRMRMSGSLSMQVIHPSGQGIVKAGFKVANRRWQRGNMTDHQPCANLQTSLNTITI